MIVGFKVTDSPTDHGQITELASEVKTNVGVDVIEAVADKGYQSPEDMSKALENGVVPNVILRDGETEVTVDFEYNPAESTELNPSSTSPPSLLKRCPAAPRALPPRKKKAASSSRTAATVRPPRSRPWKSPPMPPLTSKPTTKPARVSLAPEDFLV